MSEIKPNPAIDRFNSDEEISRLRARVEELEKERDQARAFVVWAVTEGVWGNNDLDGKDIEDKAEELGLIRLEPIRPGDKPLLDESHWFYFTWKEES